MNTRWRPRHPLQAAERAASRWHGDDQPVEVVIEHVPGMGFCQVFARRGQAAAVEQALAVGGEARTALGCSDLVAMPLAPGHWLLMGCLEQPVNLASTLAGLFASMADVSDQGHARSLFRIHGPASTTLLARCCSLDLEQAAPPRGASGVVVAQTVVLGIPAVIHRPATGAGFELLVYPGFALSLWQSLQEAARGLRADFRSGAPVAD